MNRALIALATATLAASTLFPAPAEGARIHCTITGNPITSNPGSDNLRGTRGADIICGEPSPTSGQIQSTAGRRCDITGTAGRDKLRGTRADDLICGRGGNDVIRGRGGHDTLIGGNGHDVLYGGRADDTLQGGSDQDFLYSRHRGHDLNTLRGNSGHDVFLTRDGHIDIIDGGNKRGEWDIACTDNQDVLRSAQHRDVCPGGPPTAQP